jgi:hypothetical protein
MHSVRFLLLLIAFFSLFQVSAQIPEALKNLSVYDGSVYVTYGHIITVDFVESEVVNSRMVIRKTNIAYQDYNQLIEKVQDSAKHGKWNEDKYIVARNSIRKNAFGGRIVLYTERYDMYDANNKFYFIVVRDKTGKKIFEKHLPYRTPDPISTQLFSNWAFIDVDIALPDEFSVYVNHKRTQHLSDNKFKVKKRQTTAEEKQ